MPALAGVYTRLAPRVDFVGVSLDGGVHASDAVRSFVSRYGIPYPVGLSPSVFASSTAVMALPTTMLVDREGRVARTYVGPVAPKQLTADLETLLAEPVPAAR
jgi:hypothetical protein